MTARHPQDDAVVELWSRVRVRDAEGEDEYTVVTRDAVDVARGRISMESPVGRALLGSRPGEEIVVQTPGGVRLLTVLDVAIPADPF